MKLHIISDLHLDFSRLPLDDYEFEKDATLIIAGDLAEGTRAIEFLDMVCNRVKNVIYVMGNHEYYGNQFGSMLPVELKQKLMEVSYGLADNVSICDQGSYEIDDVVFICATLWTDFFGGNESSMNEAKYYMNDYSQIKNGDFLLNPLDVYAMHNLHLEHIKRELNKHADKKCVVVTHHGPSFKSMDARYAGRTGNEFFYSDLDYLFDDHENIALWVHGHTHASMDYKINKSRVICNPRGYSRYKNPLDCENRSFNPKLKVQV